MFLHSAHHGFHRRGHAPKSPSLMHLGDDDDDDDDTWRRSLSSAQQKLITLARKTSQLPRAVDFETGVSLIFHLRSHSSPLCDPALSRRKPSACQRYFPDHFLCDVSMQELSARRHWACPLWNTGDAAHAVAHAYGAACTCKGAAVRCGDGVPCGN